MDDPTATPEPAPSPIPGERRLERPPSDRYRTEAATAGPGPEAGDPGSGGAPVRGVVFAVLVAIALAVLLTVLGGVLLISAGLVIVAAAGGWAVAMALRIGAGTTLTPARRRWLAVSLALAGVVLGQIGLWLFARAEGGVLPIIDYLGQTFGPLVPLQVAAGGLAAAWAAR